MKGNENMTETIVQDGVTSNVKFIKFINGEEILCKVEKVDDTYLYVKDPLRVVLMPPENPEDPRSQMRLGFGPWVVYMKERNHRIAINSVQSIIDKPDADITANYEQSVASLYSSLVIPNAPKLVIQ